MKTIRATRVVSTLVLVTLTVLGSTVPSNATLREADNTCEHIENRKIVVREADENTNGIVDLYCVTCGNYSSTKEIHAYKKYEINLGNGQTATVTGWLETDYNETIIDGDMPYLDTDSFSYKVLALENEYRLDNNLSVLLWNYNLQRTADLRAIEAAYSFSHERPNGEPWYKANEELLGGENLAIGHSSPAKVMSGWKESDTHNDNLLYPKFKTIAIGVFHLYIFDEDEIIPRERIVWAQSFSYKKQK